MGVGGAEAGRPATGPSTIVSLMRRMISHVSVEVSSHGLRQPPPPASASRQGLSLPTPHTSHSPPRSTPRAKGTATWDQQGPPQWIVIVDNLDGFGQGQQLIRAHLAARLALSRLRGAPRWSE